MHTTLEHHAWGLSIETLKSVYVCLVRSIIEYCAPIYADICKTQYKKIKVIQNNSICIIYKLPYDTSTDQLLEISKIESLSNRFKHLSIAYFWNAIINKNPFIMKLCADFSTNSNQELNIYNDNLQI
jgi:hypothetical protein